MITNIKTGLATISGYHPDSYSTQLLISGVNKDVDKLITDHKAVVETTRKIINVLDEENICLKNRIEELEAEQENDKQVVEIYRNRLYKKGLLTTLDNKV